MPAQQIPPFLAGWGVFKALPLPKINQTCFNLCLLSVRLLLHLLSPLPQGTPARTLQQSVLEISLLVGDFWTAYLLRNFHSHQKLLFHRSKWLALLLNITGILWTFTMGETTMHRDLEVIQVKGKSEIILSEDIVCNTEQEFKEFPKILSGLIMNHTQ